MAKFKNGILGGFNGKVGSVVGSSWKGISVMRSLAQSVSNPKSKKQRTQRSRFTLVVNLVRTILSYVRVSYVQFTHKMSGYNAAVSYNVQNAVSGMSPDCSIDYGKVLVARGSLATADDATAVYSKGKVSFTWKDNSGMGNALATDKAFPIVINRNRKVSCFSNDVGTRADGKCELVLPAAWDGDYLEVYLAFSDIPGRRNSNSVHPLSVTGTHALDETVKDVPTEETGH